MNVHLKLAPLIGNESLRVPPFKFQKILVKDYTALAQIATTCGDFEVTAPEFYHEALYPMLTGYIVREKEQIVAFAILSRSCGRLTISYLWVKPSHRHKGMGWFLINLCVLKAKATLHTELHVYIRIGNIPAQELFKKAHFEEVGITIPDGFPL